MNQFATPGLGSLMAWRLVAGAGQLAIFLVGFAMFVMWFVEVMRRYYGLMFSDTESPVRMWLVFLGLALCGCAWLWALFTSVSLLREAKRNEQAAMQRSMAAAAATPPIIK